MLAQVVDVVENALGFWARIPVKKREDLKSRRECINLVERMLFEYCNGMDLQDEGPYLFALRVSCLEKL